MWELCGVNVILESVHALGEETSGAWRRLTRELKRLCSRPI